MLKFFIIVLLACISLFSCNNLIESILYPYNNPEDFMYYKKDYQLGKSEQLKTENFYWLQGNGVSGDYYLYLKFYKDGGVYYFGGTALEPDTVFQKNFLAIKRKKNGIPQDRKASWGYFQCYNNKIKFTILDYRAMSSKTLKYIGEVQGDTLHLKMFEQALQDTVFQYVMDERFGYYKNN